MPQHQCLSGTTPERLKRLDIAMVIANYTIEELNAIEKYCINYHEAYEKANSQGASVVTEITIG